MKSEEFNSLVDTYMINLYFTMQSFREKIKFAFDKDKCLSRVWKACNSLLEVRYNYGKAITIPRVMANDLFMLYLSESIEFEFSEIGAYDYFRYNSKKLLKDKKKKEYAPDIIDDRLHNFKEAARYLHINWLETAVVYMSKHLVSINDIIIRRHNLTFDNLIEKFGDAVNYCILIEGLLTDLWKEERR